MRAIFAVLVVFAVLLILILVSCPPSRAFIDESQDSKPAGSSGTSSTESGVELIRYFVDRTESLQGFVNHKNEKDSDYVKALGDIWEVGKKLGGSKVKEQFYDFGQMYLYKVQEDAFKRTVILRTFYGINSQDRSVRDMIDQSNEKDHEPFLFPLNYMKDKGISKNTLDILITDLYVQNGRQDCFSDLFQYAFTQGLSGALFAVESAFIDGKISSVIRTNDDKKIEVKNGRSTFFVFVIGDGTNIEKYCENLITRFNLNLLKFESTLFIIKDNPTKAQVLIQDKFKKANGKRFAEDQYKYSMVNLNRTKLRKWQEKTVKDELTYVAVDADATAYMIVPTDNSRYFIGIPKDDTHDFKYNIEMSIEYFAGGKPEKGVNSVFMAYDRPQDGILTSQLIEDDDIPPDLKVFEGKKDTKKDYLYLDILTKNKNMAKGVYKISYSIIPEAIVPDWVEDRSAVDAEELKESADQDIVKVLNLKLIYSSIVEVFKNVNKSKTSVYSDTFYLVKNR
jgi:hypothetical protein